MRVIRQHIVGGPEVLHIEDVPPPVPAAGEVLVRTRAIGVNPVDVAVRSGAYPMLGEPPFVLGWDVAGVVQSHGDLFDEGDEVLGLVGFPGAGATYAELLTAAESQLVRTERHGTPWWVRHFWVPSYR